MSLLKTLSAQALLGTERHSAELPATTGALADLLNNLGKISSSAETGLLRAAGSIAIYSRAGYQPPRQTMSHPKECAAEKYPTLTHAALLNALPHIIQDGPRQLLREALQTLRDSEQLVPAKLLPQLLNAGKEYPQLAALIIAVAGERGLWLAAYNPDWHYALVQAQPLDKNLWDHGQMQDRLHYIVNLRQQNPDDARLLIAEALGELDARDRATLLMQLKINLREQDEEFIAQQLSNRSKEVRSAAASLLRELPNSQYVARMQERLQQCLRKERKLFREHWVLQPPEAFPKEWAEDALEEKRPQHESLGDKAWWLMQLARSVPLVWWQTTLSLSPSELLSWALDSDWSKALLGAWYQAMQRDAHSDWAEAFLKLKPNKHFQIDTGELIGYLPTEKAASYWLELLSSADAKHRRGDYLSRICKKIDGNMPVAFARVLLERLKKHIADDDAKYDYSLRHSLLEFACVIPPELFSEATQGWPLDKSNSITETLARLLQVIEQRRLLLHFLASEKS